MVNRGFVLGLSEGLGILALGLSHPIVQLWVPAGSAVYFIVRQKAWLLPKSPGRPAKLLFLGLLTVVKLSLLYALATAFCPVLALLAVVVPKSSQLSLEKGTLVAQLCVWTSLAVVSSLEFGLVATGLTVCAAVAHQLEAQVSKPLHNKDSHKTFSFSMLAATLIALVNLLFGSFSGLWLAPDNNDAVMSLLQSLLVVLALKVLPHIIASSNLNSSQSAVGLLAAIFCSCFLGPFAFNIIAFMLVSLELSLRRTDEEVLPLKSAGSFWKQVLSHPDSRRLAGFLVLSLMFMGVEALYGYWTNSLGLISDSVHMAFDCTALAIGLYASFLSRLPADRTFTYGHGRFEVLSGLINSIFLVFVGFRVFVESIERILEPPEIQTENLILVSVLGLLVNLVGLCFFHNHGEENNSNMRGVFLHVLADTLGSVGVITSSIFVQNFQWYIADPICSLVISLLIFLSCLPLLTDSMEILTLKDVTKASQKARKLLKEVPGVASIEAVHAWTLKNGHHVVSAKVTTQQSPLAVTAACKVALAQFKSVTVQVKAST